MDKRRAQTRNNGHIGKRQMGVLVSVKQNKPHSRYMTFYHEDLTFYTPTSFETQEGFRKIRMYIY
jgi:general stress protein 26